MLLPKGFQQTDSPLADKVYVTKEQIHQAYHHYLKVVSTHYEVGRSFGGQKNTVLQYQMVVNSQVRLVGSLGRSLTVGTFPFGCGWRAMLTLPFLPLSINR